VMHAFGGSGGARSEGFFYLDRRNWLLTSLRNGDRAQVKAVCRLALGRALRAFRGNVTGKIRRGDAPSLRLVSTWGRILLSVAARAGTLRSTKTPGARAPKRVRSFLQPSGGIPSPQRRPGGPQVVYVDVSSVLESGEPRSSEAQAVSDLILGGKFSNPSIELVPVVKSADGLGTRRVTNTEMAILLGSGEHPNRTTSTAELAELSVHPQSGTFLAVASGKRLEITPVEISCDSGQGDPPERFTIEGSGDGTGLAAELAAKLGQ